MLRQCANLNPDGAAFKYVDYGRDWDGVAETVTWYQLYRRIVNVARELKRCASRDDRAVILIPQGLDYIYAFLGALQAGLIAVPLSLPMGGATDERVDSVMLDAAPTVILTTSSVVDDISEHVTAQPLAVAPSVIEVDRLDLDAPTGSGIEDDNRQTTVYLQYTSGSTRTPAGVMITYKNLLSNYQQLMSGYFAHRGGLPPRDVFLMSWLPFYHDMGLVLGICAPIMAGFPAVLTSPIAFLQRPARWLQLMATGGQSFGGAQAFSAAPNFAFELAVGKTSDDDLAGFDLSGVNTILSGSERVHPATLKRFTDRFARFNFDEAVLRPSYGLAEATVYVATSPSSEPPTLIEFDADELSAGQAKRSTGEGSTPLVSYDLPRSPIVRIVDPETCTECPGGTVGEIWVHGDNVAAGYWNRPAETERTFGGKIVSPSDGTPEGPWLRTGDSGFVSENKLFIIGRIKDLLIVRGRNHSPDDIEATIQEITQGRCVAIAVPGDGGEKLVTIIEVKKRGASKEDAMERLGVVKREVTAAISTSHGLSVSDLVLVSPGAIPITTSGKVRRAECVKLYRHGKFNRLNA
jgi:acyl-CoA synthetase (AMP-forming)/AMP-acid ligase II